MYFILPIGHEDSEVRRVPWVTASIAAICILVHIFIMQPRLEKENEMFFALDEAYGYYLEHPYLNPSKEMAAELRVFGIDLEGGRVTGQFGGDPPEEVYEEEEEEGYADPGLLMGDPDEEGYESETVEAESDPRAEQARLDELFGVYLDLKKKNGERLGLIPADFEVLDLLAAMFLHADWWHLLGNLLFFWICAPTLEDVWGRPFFAAFFVVAGCISGLFWMFLNMDGMLPMIGASGAIAGLMGAFAIRFRSSNITFFYAYLWILGFGKGTFSLPAWLTLGLWFAREVLSMAIVEGSNINSGVAFAAHVGGFAFGALVVIGMSRQRIEERFLAPAIEKKLGDELGGRTNVELAKAHTLIEQGRDEEAWGTLLQALDKAPNDPDSATALWDLAVKLGRREQAVAPVVRQLKLELRGGDRLLALQRWEEIQDLVVPGKLDVDLVWRLAEAQLAQGQRTEARDLIDHLPLATAAGQQLAIKVRLLKVAMDSGARLTLPLAEHCAALPDIPEPMKGPINAGLHRGREIESEHRRRQEQLGSIEIIPFADQVPAPAQAVAPPPVPLVNPGPPQGLPNLPTGIFNPVPSTAPVPAPSYSAPVSAPSGSLLPNLPAGIFDPVSPVASAPPAGYPSPVPASSGQLLPDLPAGIFDPVPSPVAQVTSYLAPAPQVTSYLTPTPQTTSYLTPAPQPPSINTYTPPPPPPRAAPPAVPAPAPVAVSGPLRILEGIPLRFRQDQLEVSEGANAHLFALPTLAAVAVARIDEAARPWMLIDLFLDPPAQAGARVVRLRSTRYDPRRELAPEAADPFQAFQAFVQKLLQVSRARALPTTAAAQGQPFARFPGLAEYESAIRRL